MKKCLIALLVFIGLIISMGATGLIATASAADLYKGHTGNTGGTTYIPFVAFVKQAEKAGVRIEVNAGKTLTASLLLNAKGQIHFTSAIPTAYMFLGKNARMYKKLKNGPELQAKIRSILGYQAGTMHPIVFEKSGIKTFKDMKGKTVFTGPPSGTATATQEDLIEAVTGYKPKKDYKAIHLAWGQGVNAMRDGKLDVYMRPSAVGSAGVQELALKDQIRLLSIPEAALETPLFKKILARPGRGISMISKKTYKNQANESDVRMLAAEQYIASNVYVSEDVVYKATKAFWTNLKDVHLIAVSLQSITKETAFTALEAPLHKGAYRYYKEAGFNIPQNLIPPEAK